MFNGFVVHCELIVVIYPTC